MLAWKCKFQFEVNLRSQIWVWCEVNLRSWIADFEFILQKNWKAASQTEGFIAARLQSNCSIRNQRQRTIGFSICRDDLNLKSIWSQFEKSNLISIWCQLDSGMNAAVGVLTTRLLIVIAWLCTAWCCFWWCAGWCVQKSKNIEAKQK